MLMNLKEQFKRDGMFLYKQSGLMIFCLCFLAIQPKPVFAQAAVSTPDLDAIENSNFVATVKQWAVDAYQWSQTQGLLDSGFSMTFAGQRVQTEAQKKTAEAMEQHRTDDSHNLAMGSISANKAADATLSPVSQGCIHLVINSHRTAAQQSSIMFSGRAEQMMVNKDVSATAAPNTDKAAAESLCEGPTGTSAFIPDNYYSGLGSMLKACK